MSERKAPYVLKHAIIRDTRDPASGEEREEVLKSAGETIIVRRPKAKDLLVFDDDGSIAGITALLKRVVKLDAEMIDNLDAEDFTALGELVAPEKKSGLKTGATA